MGWVFVLKGAVLLLGSALLVACAPSDPGGALAATRVGGRAAIAVPRCDGGRVSALEVRDADDHVLWQVSAATPASPQSSYVLGVVPSGFTEKGSWSSSLEQQRVVVVLVLGGVRLSTGVKFADIKDSALYLHGKESSRRDVDSQIVCSH